MSFTRMDQGTVEDWMVIGGQCAERQSRMPAVIKSMLRQYVSQETYEIIRTHQDFQGKHYYALMGRDPDARRKYQDEPWFELAKKFTDEWDQTSFDPSYDTLPFEHFEPMVDRVFSKKLFEISAGAAN